MPGNAQLEELLESNDESKKDAATMHILKKLDSGQPLAQSLPLSLAVKMLYRRWRLDGTITKEMEKEAATTQESQEW